jgi:hypothetical protein
MGLFMKHTILGKSMGSKPRIIFLSLLIVLTSCTNNQVMRVPFSPNSVISNDGIFNFNEWNQSATIDLSKNNWLHLMQNEDFLFLAIKDNEESGKYIDLYMANDSIGTVNFHASMQLGERQLKGNWNDTIPAWRWGNNSNWTANKVKIIDKNENLSFVESVEVYQGFEFKIAKGKIQCKKSKIRIEIKDFIGQEEDIVFPDPSDRMNTENWFLIELGSL